MRPSFWRYFPAWFVYVLLWLISQLPYRVLRTLGGFFGWLIGPVFHIRKNVISRNMAACFPQLSDEQQQQLIKDNYRETGYMVTQTLYAFFHRSNRLFDRLTITGEQHLQECIDKQQGVLLVSGHFTALDVGGRALCQRFPVAGVYRPHKNPVMEYVVTEARTAYAQDMFSRDRLKSIVRHIKKGGIVWYAPDQDYRRGHSLFSNFFGVAANTITATHQLARMGDAKVLFYSVKRIDKAPYYQLQISPVLSEFPSKDVHVDTDRINQGIEAMVKQAPEQYLWLHKRFKTRPPNSPDFYNDEKAVADTKDTI
ncbi:LpxL/LpxP family Kdo(2)-lipid IV(A) lauroyl/palmitoleoyl acyltransferase [Marinicella gelatinilytica]|uniref:LpxL/LpxP family Kdo(2)-lipid IV(A) lauroyl/palmitoleoyl acyltransferase n=1 Tax=Marinicella gelatinilytica TaxID=2996017 RepID=UPI002260E227|nr:LpxL/LpxP family Kdo(2)-lipid IV(A) lauroyl/palmitoleoyl acyltransferase [Marinicella gelatinilytica]MCX7545689.1 LpxL/LpxP family Kdo(2)-lipid IV(A) lauroyl/palmitoleoyl acyltransferase [Marinicella gelatinilytica]